MKSLLFGRRREALVDQLVATGAAGGLGADPVDGSTGYRRMSGGAREIPEWTREKARAYSHAAYRINPMARAIFDTYTSFCVGDSGLTLQCTHADVRKVAVRFWNDPRNRLGLEQELLLRTFLMNGEEALEVMVGDISGLTFFSPIDPARVVGVELDRGNPMWPGLLRISMPFAEPIEKSIVSPDLGGLRSGEVLWSTYGRATVFDTRGFPFLGPILDDLDSYDQVLHNLVDRTALARYFMWDVTVEGSQDDVDKFVRDRGGRHVPSSASVEVHNESVTWEAKNVVTGAQEDTQTAQSMLTNAAAGAGLSKHWLAEPDGANRATSLTMAEPVRRRVGGVQNLWLAMRTEQVRHAVDQAVARGRLPREVVLEDGTTVTPAETVMVTGPEIAQADARVTAQVLLQLSQGLTGMVKAGIMSADAAKFAARKAWEDYVGVPYIQELDKPDGNGDDIATAVDDQATKTRTPAGGLLRKIS